MWSGRRPGPARGEPLCPPCVGGGPPAGSIAGAIVCARTSRVWPPCRTRCTPRRHAVNTAEAAVRYSHSNSANPTCVSVLTLGSGGTAPPLREPPCCSGGRAPGPVRCGTGWRRACGRNPLRSGGYWPASATCHMWWNVIARRPSGLAANQRLQYEHFTMVAAMIWGL